jgi:threonine-phosphate decarboxylase
VIPIPAFSEYARACRAYGCAVHTIPLGAPQGIAGETLRPGDLAVFNNPHNPTGACLSRTEMLKRIANARESGATVLVDEAFIDYSPGDAVTREAAAQTGVVAIRSLTKFFGCPGLRVGYAVASPESAALLATHLPPWPVTTLALNALAEALRDGEYAQETLERNRRERTRLSEALTGLGCAVSPSAANFLFLRLPDFLPAAAVRDRLMREHGILVRECDSFQGVEPGRYFRVAVRSESDNARLIHALENVFQGLSCHRNHA